ncbi:MAG: type I restriction enzyme HsdR N-terminal domain-containing protein [Planctomycetes bacterium]|nr:type I restriction enzyme HsdR N-terminal domain-containing protein [Planctomycetota bacterium]
MSAQSSLSLAIADVRRRIQRAGSKGLNEENTKATLLEPLLRALGWDIEDVDEVAREFRVKSRDKPVDYALLVLREPKLLVEAKGLGENLDDRRWANQIMGYAAVAGVEWIVLTDGNEYRIYNTHAAVRVEEKLFRSVRIGDEGELVESTLKLISKAELRTNRIEALWRADFVDRQVKGALERLFAQDSDMLLVNHVTRNTKNLTADEVRGSLRRCKVQLDFPLSNDEDVAPARSPKKDRAPRSSTASGSHDVTLRQLIDAGVLRPPVELSCHYKGRDLTARIERDGTVTCMSATYPSLSIAGSVARASIRGRRPDGKLPATNGWSFWSYRASDGSLQKIDQARQAIGARERAASPRERAG